MHIQYILINIFGIFASPYKVVIVYVCVKLHTKTFYLHSAECRVRESSDEDPQDFPPVPDSNKILVKKNFFCLFSFSFFFGHFPPLVKVVISFPRTVLPLQVGSGRPKITGSGFSPLRQRENTSFLVVQFTSL